MSRQVLCVRVPQLTPHPDADTLDIGMVWGTTPVIVKRGEFTPGQLAALWEVDTVHPEIGRIKARRLRGVFSMGMLTPVKWCSVDFAHDTLVEGDDLTARVGATAHDSDPSDPEEKCSLGSTHQESCSHTIPRYTDIEDLRKHWHEIRHGELLVATEKVHGTSVRYMHDGERLWVCSRNCVVRPADSSVYWQLAREYQLAERLQTYAFYVFYGEIYGPGIQRKFHYGLGGPDLVIYDVRLPNGPFLDEEYFSEFCNSISLSHTRKVSCSKDQTLEDLETLADNPSAYTDQHISEGIVVRVHPFRLTRKGERAIFKLVSRKYLEQKGKV